MTDFNPHSHKEGYDKGYEAGVAEGRRQAKPAIDLLRKVLWLAGLKCPTDLDPNADCPVCGESPDDGVCRAGELVLGTMDVEIRDLIALADTPPEESPQDG